MAGPSCPSPPGPGRWPSLPAAAVLTAAVCACSVYANLSWAVTDPADYRFFPPFEPRVNANENWKSAAVTEYARIGGSVAEGKGFANPFGGTTGPTAWMPPALPAILAGLYWVSGGNRTFAMVVLIGLQVLVLVGTGLLVLALARQTAGRVGTGVAAAAFLAGLAGHFHLYFQRTDDCWLVLLALDLVVVGFAWFRPLHRWRGAAGWGLLGGLCALSNPIVGLTWGTGSLVLGWQQRAWGRLALAVAVAGLALAPWTVRNYLVFGRLVPVKSNLAYELYQSQCLQPDGVIQRPTLAQHPGRAGTREAREYEALGESAFLERKGEEFRQAVAANPTNFLDRVAERFVAATLWYVPFDRDREAAHPWAFRASRLTHPLPFLGLLVLVLTATRRPLDRSQWAVIGVYALYLLPYVGVSYYERYVVPLLGVNVLLVTWGAARLLSLISPEGRCRQALFLPPPPAPV